VAVAVSVDLEVVNMVRLGAQPTKTQQNNENHNEKNKELKMVDAITSFIIKTIFDLGFRL